MWGTPVARDDQKSPEAHLAMKARMGGNRTAVTSLTVQAKLWPTPRAHDGSSGSTAHSSSDFRPTLKQYAQTMWPTPRASMNENRTTKNAPSHGVTHGLTLAGEASRQAQTTSTDGNNGSPRADLNPRFVAALMGLPWDWLTPYTSAETASCPNVPPKHGHNSPTDSTKD